MTVSRNVSNSSPRSATGKRSTLNRHANGTCSRRVYGAPPWAPFCVEPASKGPNRTPNAASRQTSPKATAPQSLRQAMFNR
jgi:hypothetical protein